ncbi:DeoR/GlpR family DNA-binding transcription regulator [Halobacillus naozhouensis]|uniref:DeoR/GlpR family DNA-binding transcription regulator n=1 Tax=Halobacillus naozhouensis TaxID=554880 RepID=A0ABY8IVI2_9BACI|nr:DeoR/GlpR family DNA-binding transcription regulator [Halobacillus naozhouensis]WFT74205.1 DeoR/GlpR family DNA-binding transcription regulator [Halobacillus naozhouensis]
MIAVERKQRIIEYVKQHYLASVAQLAKEFDVHEATIRRDLSEIEKEGTLRRTHGGVVLAQDISSEPNFSERVMENTNEKERIGALAASLIEEGDTIILDSGTTTLQIVKHILNFNQLTIITNDINIAVELRNASHLKVFVTGGVLTPGSFMLNGMHTNEMLRTVQVNKAFIGTPAINARSGLMHFDDQLVPAKKEMIRVAREIIVVADHTKLGRVSLHNVSSINDVHHLVTDVGASKEEIDLFKQENVQIFQA